MPWFLWTTPTRRDSTTPSDKPPPPSTWAANLNRPDPSHYTTPQTITLTALTTATTLLLAHLFYQKALRRIPTVDHLRPTDLRHRTLHGWVPRVGDADNFHLFHTPGGRWAGWHWVPWRRIARWTPRRFRHATLHIRIAGVDAPEAAHFGRAAQPHAPEALAWLRATLLRRDVRVALHAKDQYGRAVATVWVWRWGVWRRDVGLEMLRRGWATVYEAKSGCEFGGREQAYRRAEAKARQKRVGIWRAGEAALESPRDYKTRMKGEESAK